MRPSPTGLATTRDLTDIWRVTLPDASPHRGLGAREPTWDLASLVVHPDYRRGADRGLVVATMFQAILMFVSGAGGRWLTATLDLVVLDAIQRQCCSPFTAFRGPEPVRHSASPACLPVYCDLDGYRRTLRLVDPERHVVLFEGRGLEPFVHRDRPLEGSPRR